MRTRIKILLLRRRNLACFLVLMKTAKTGAIMMAANDLDCSKKYISDCICAFVCRSWWEILSSWSTWTWRMVSLTRLKDTIFSGRHGIPCLRHNSCRSMLLLSTSTGDYHGGANVITWRISIRFRTLGYRLCSSNCSQASSIDRQVERPPHISSLRAARCGWCHASIQFSTSSIIHPQRLWEVRPISSQI